VIENTRYLEAGFDIRHWNTKVIWLVKEDKAGICGITTDRQNMI